jgi:hypothetical protein
MPAAGGGFAPPEATRGVTQAIPGTQEAAAASVRGGPQQELSGAQASALSHQQADIAVQPASSTNPAIESPSSGVSSGEIIEGFHSSAVGEVLPILSGVIPPQAAPVVAATIAVGAGFVAAVGTAMAPSTFIAGWFSKVYLYIRNFIGNYLLGKMGVKEAQLRKVAPKLRETHFMRMHIVEISATIIGAAVYGFSFMIAKKAGFTPDIFILYLATAGVAITVHEVGHRYIAHHYRDAVEIQLWDVGIITMFVTALLTGVVFAKPTRNIVSNAAALQKGELGRIMLAGPGLSLIIAAISVPFLFLGGVYTEVATLSIMFNLLIGTYHMMPFPPMDGKAVLGWNGYLWLLMFVPLMVMYFYLFLI